MSEFKITIDRIAFGGAGVGRLPDGKVCFVHGTLPGEEVLVNVVGEKKNFANGVAEEILTPSAERIPVEIPVPGGVYMHMTYEAENRIKQAQLHDFFHRHAPEICDGGIFKESLIPEHSLHYRNKITLHSQIHEGNTLLGYYDDASQMVEDLPVCPLADSEISAMLTEIRADNSFMNSLEDGDKVTIRHADNGLFYWINNAGKEIPMLTFNTAYGPLDVSPESFYQVNNEGAVLMQQEIFNELQNLSEIPSAFLDLYCGAGFFSLVAAAAGIGKIIGADIDSAAAAVAAANLERAGCENYRFHGYPAHLIVGRLIKKGGDSPVMLVDPPRHGLDRQTVQMICSSHIKKLIYVSCGPDTLVRDLRVFGSAGFRLVSNVMLNMFPRTAHIESITVLKR